MIMKPRFRSEASPNISPPHAQHDSELHIRKSAIKLPKIKTRLNEEEVAQIGKRVLDLRKLHYGPKGCSRSVVMDKVLLRKKINQRSKTESADQWGEADTNIYRYDILERGLGRSMLTPQKYISKIYL